MRVAVRSGPWLAFLLLALHRLYDLDVARMPNGAPTGPDAAASVVMALARLTALGLGGYLVAATLLTLVVGLVGAVGPMTGRLVPRTLHEGLLQLCGLTFALTVAAPTVAAAADDPSVITMHRLAEPSADGDDAPITMRRLAPPAPVTDPSNTEAPAAPASPASHVIARGEHLWAVAEQSLTSAWGAPPTDAEIDPYWRELIRRNQSKLPDPRNPDLVYPGLELEVPTVPARDV